MTTLFIDTTYDVTLGLLGPDRKWIDLRQFQGQKSSVLLQPETMKLLKDHHIAPKSLDHVVSLAGPGFYTGLRLAEGFCDVFKFFNIPHLSFYSHDIPVFCGETSGTWITKAYRGEYFFHSWSQGVLKNEMVATKDLERSLSECDRIFIHSDHALDELSRGLIKKSVQTSELLRNEPEKIFTQVFDQKLERESFYFRPPEDEFKANP